jgi:hypothetical protein
MPKLSALPTGTPKLTDIVPGVDKAANATDQYTWQQVAALVLSLAYPVGYIVANTTGNNPTTELGFGTWVQYAKGRTLVGQDPAQAEFDTVEEVGGEKTHTLSWDEMPAHSHGVSDPGHGHSGGANYFMDAGGGGNLGLNTPGNRFAQGLSPLYINGSGTGIWINNAGSSFAHNNLQPYQVVYFFKRTA